MICLGVELELRRYWDLLLRRWWIPVVLAVATAAMSLFLTTGIQKTYSATLGYVVMTQPGTPMSGFFNYDSYYNWLSSEYMGDDLTELVKTRDFVNAVKKELNDSTVDVDSLMGSVKATRAHRLVSLEVTTGSQDQTERLAAAIGAAIPPAVSRYFPQFNDGKPFLELVDPPVAKPSMNASKMALDIGLRVGLAFVLGVALVLLLDYLDTSIRSAEEAELLLRLPVMGEIPVEK
ncbi:MAG: hypothetical protein EPO21_13315 [Chloroflexota bacterium]|nr:MAG: hypothetical protein EPO21_13315 [Chloroflexota bacterium]